MNKVYIGGVKVDQSLKKVEQRCFISSCGKAFTCHLECGDIHAGPCYCPDCVKGNYEPFSKLSQERQKGQRKYYCKSRFGDDIG